MVARNWKLTSSLCTLSAGIGWIVKVRMLKTVRLFLEKTDLICKEANLTNFSSEMEDASPIVIYRAVGCFTDGQELTQEDRTFRVGCLRKGVGKAHPSIFQVQLLRATFLFICNQPTIQHKMLVSCSNIASLERLCWNAVIWAPKQISHPQTLSVTALSLDDRLLKTNAESINTCRHWREATQGPSLIFGVVW